MTRVKDFINCESILSSHSLFIEFRKKKNLEIIDMTKYYFEQKKEENK